MQTTFDILPGDRSYVPPMLDSHENILFLLNQIFRARLARKIELKEAKFSLQIINIVVRILKTRAEEAKSAAKLPAKVAVTSASSATLAATIAPACVPPGATAPETIASGSVTPAPAVPQAAPPTTATAPPRKPAQPVPPDPEQGVMTDPYGCFQDYNARTRAANAAKAAAAK